MFRAILIVFLFVGPIRGAWSETPIENLVKSSGNIKEAIGRLGDDHVTVESRNCQGKAQRTCQKIPYNVNHCHLFDSDAECEKKKARNIEKRNEWLLNSGKFKTAQQSKVEKIQEEKSQIEKAIADYRSSTENTEEKLQENREKIQKLRDRYEVLKDKKGSLEQEILSIEENNPDIRAGEPTAGEDLASLFTGEEVDYDEQDEKDLRRIKQKRGKLRDVRRDMGSLGEEVSEVEGQTRVTREELQNMQDGLERHKDALEKWERAYTQVSENLDDEGAKQRAYVEGQTLNAKKKAAERYAKEKLQELDKQKELASFLLRDFESLQKDLKINDLEARALVDRVNDKVRDSVMGKYIQKQMEKTLGIALEQSCQSAKLCAQHDSVNNDIRERLQNNGIQSLREKLEKERQSKEK